MDSTKQQLPVSAWKKHLIHVLIYCLIWLSYFFLLFSLSLLETVFAAMIGAAITLVFVGIYRRAKAHSQIPPKKRPGVKQWVVFLIKLPLLLVLVYLLFRLLFDYGPSETMSVSFRIGLAIFIINAMEWFDKYYSLPDKSRSAGSRPG